MPSRPFCILWGIAFGLLALSIAHGQINSQRQAPKLLAQFYDKNNEWHKLTVDLLQRELTKDPSGWMYVRIKDDRGLANRLQLLRRASVFQKLDEARLTYLIGDADGYDVESFFSKVGDETHICEGCVTIRAIDFKSLDKLFRIRRIARQF